MNVLLTGAELLLVDAACNLQCARADGHESARSAATWLASSLFMKTGRVPPGPLCNPDEDTAWCGLDSSVGVGLASPTSHMT